MKPANIIVFAVPGIALVRSAVVQAKTNTSFARGHSAYSLGELATRSIVLVCANDAL